MSAVADKLREARALIAKGWTQNQFDDELTAQGFTCVCAVGAIGHAYGLNLSVSRDIDKLRVLPAVAALKNAIGADSILGKMAKRKSVVAWNDAPERTQAEVLAAFDKAIELAESGQ